MLNNKVDRKYKNKIVEAATDIYKRKCNNAINSESEHGISKDDLKNYPHLFVLLGIANIQIKAEKARKIPETIIERIGGKEFSLFLAKDLDWYKEVMQGLHRFPEKIAANYYNAIHKINTDYCGDASKIWNDNPTSAELICRFLEFDGVGIKVATWAANVLTRDYEVKLQDKYSIEISPDIHIKRALYRLGLIQKLHDNDFSDINDKRIIYAAKDLNPEFPGVIDYACWKIGNEKTCTNNCCNSKSKSDCPFHEFCIRQGV